ncbi:MAG TPA: transporter [Longimicrobiales bacterium]
MRVPFLPRPRRRARPRGPTLFGLVLFGLGLLAGRAACAQDLGHKVLGAVGIDAGVQPEPGLYLGDRIIRFAADRLRDRHGRLVPVQGLEIDAIANVFGAALTLKPRGAPYLSFAFGFPLARVSLSVDDPRASVDRAGFGDLYVQPLRLGWRTPEADISAAYAFYAPTGRFEPRGGGGIGRGFWAHQLSLGVAVRGDPERRMRASALLSYDFNRPKRGIDIRRGNTFQIQGGAGMRVLDWLDAGLAGFALWQVTDDSGADVPPALRGARDRVFGLGPELDILIPALRMRLDLRAEWDFGVRSRPQGRILVASLTYVAWRPDRPATNAGER